MTRRDRLSTGQEDYRGAIEYRESARDDVKMGKVTFFPQSVKLKRGETVSRAHRDRVNKKVMKDPRRVDL